MEPIHKRSIFHEIIGFLLIVILLLIVLTQYNSPLVAGVAGSVEKNVGKYQFVQDTVNMPFIKVPTSTIRDFFSGKSNLAKKYTYIDYAQLQNEYNQLNINETRDGKLAKSIVVLNYHGTIAGNPTDPYSISVNDFKNHMFALKKEGYQTISFEDLESFMRGEKEIPEKSFVLTFDDGLKDTYYNVDPILKTLNYSAIMFVIAGESLEKNSKYYLSKDELHEMDDSGRWDIESHSYDGHGYIKIDENNDTGPFFSNKMWLDGQNRLETDEEYRFRVSKDLEKSKILLENEFNKPVLGFALPFGEFGQRESNYPGAKDVMLDVSEDYFDLVFYQFKPTTNKDYRANYNNTKTDFYLIMRLPQDDVKSPDSVLEQVHAAEAIDLPYIEDYSNKIRWVDLWGVVNTSSSDVSLRNDVDGSGAMTYLDGSYLWTDYTFKTNLNQVNAKKVILVARFQDFENYIFCSYKENEVSITSVRDDKRYFINNTRVQNISFASGTELSISVSGNLVSCKINGNTVIESYVDNMPPNGGVGLRAEEFNSINDGASFTGMSVE